MRRTLFAATTLVASCALVEPANAASLCVADRPECFAKALAGAHDGDVIRLGPGTFRGGVTIAAGVEVRGTGAGATRIVGGGPVIDIAREAGTVTLRGVSISGGVVTGERDAPEWALGAGVAIRGPGPTVTIADSVVENNFAAPSATVPFQCEDGPCRLAVAAGAGIYNAGSLKLLRTAVVGNRVADRPGRTPLATFAEGGGIYSIGALEIVDSTVSENEARAVPPNGRAANGAGVVAEAGTLLVRRSLIARNRAFIRSAFPAGQGSVSVGGGILTGGAATATIDASRIEENSVNANSAVGDAIAFSGGVHGNGPVTIRDSVFAANAVNAATAPGSPGMASADSGVGNLNVGATIERSRFAGNVVTATAGGGGPALARAGALWTWAGDPIVLLNSLVSGNSVQASATGEVTALGAGILNPEALELHGTTVALNRAHASGRSGVAAGGGIWNGRTPETLDFVPRLSIFDSLLAGNLLTASGREIVVRGGGLLTAEPATVNRTHIVANLPDQCVGCGVASASVRGVRDSGRAPRVRPLAHRGDLSRLRLDRSPLDR